MVRCRGEFPPGSTKQLFTTKTDHDLTTVTWIDRAPAPDGAITRIALD
jgi:hypothetical protein